MPRAQVALAWVMRSQAVTAPIVGASKAAHLDDAIAALSIELAADEIETLESSDVPHEISGFQ